MDERGPPNVNWSDPHVGDRVRVRYEDVDGCHQTLGTITVVGVHNVVAYGDDGHLYPVRR